MRYGVHVWRYVVFLLIILLDPLRLRMVDA